MSKPTFLTAEQEVRIEKMTHHIHELKMLVEDKRTERLQEKDASIEEPLALMASRILTEVERANKELQIIEDAKLDIARAERHYAKRSETAEAFYRAMKAAYPDADLDVFLDIAEDL